MAATSSGPETQRVPVLLLKTRSTPTDAYEDLFSSTPRRRGDNEGGGGGGSSSSSRSDGGGPGMSFEPVFVPVLHHSFRDDGMQRVDALLRGRKIGSSPGCAYGGLVFTSQRAVEGFAKLVEDGKGDESWPHLQDVPVYSVGPATTRALRAVPQNPPLQVFGEHTGVGDVLAPFILEHYGQWYRGRGTKPPLLFLVGEQRRDVIPKTLMDPGLPTGRRIEVMEVVVYGTGVMESFAEDFAAELRRTADRPSRWVVVFSPTGCDSMLRGLDIVDETTGRAKEGYRSSAGRTTHIATIGPTTRSHLQNTFGYEPDVCAEKPSPEGVLAGIEGFLRGRI